MDCTTCVPTFVQNGGCELFGDNPSENDPTYYGISEECAEKCQIAAMVECDAKGGNNSIDSLYVTRREGSSFSISPSKGLAHFRLD